MNKRMFEQVDEASSKFWEVWRDGNEVHTRYGKIGTAGKKTVKDEGTLAAAKKLLDRLVTEKTKKGYVEVGLSANKAAPEDKGQVSADPGKIATQIARIEAAASKAGLVLPAGASAAALAAAEAKLRITFPPELRAFYLAHDGGPNGEAVCSGRELLSVEGMVAQWSLWKDLFDQQDLDDDDAVPGPGVKKKWWIPKWIPITHDFAGNHHMLDLAPGKGGTPGQVLSFWHDAGERTREGADFLTWLQKQAWGKGAAPVSPLAEYAFGCVDASGGPWFALKREGSNTTPIARLVGEELERVTDHPDSAMGLARVGEALLTTSHYDALGWVFAGGRWTSFAMPKGDGDPGDGQLVSDGRHAAYFIARQSRNVYVWNGQSLAPVKGAPTPEGASYVVGADGALYVAFGSTRGKYRGEVVRVTAKGAKGLAHCPNAFCDDVCVAGEALVARSGNQLYVLSLAKGASWEGPFAVEMASVERLVPLTSGKVLVVGKGLLLRVFDPQTKVDAETGARLLKDGGATMVVLPTADGRAVFLGGKLGVGGNDDPAMYPQLWQNGTVVPLAGYEDETLEQARRQAKESTFPW